MKTIITITISMLLVLLMGIILQSRINKTTEYFNLLFKVVESNQKQLQTEQAKLKEACVRLCADIPECLKPCLGGFVAE